jgi:hypothetical protein
MRLEGAISRMRYPGVPVLKRRSSLRPQLYDSNYRSIQIDHFLTWFITVCHIRNGCLSVRCSDNSSDSFVVLFFWPFLLNDLVNEVSKAS